MRLSFVALPLALLLLVHVPSAFAAPRITSVEVWPKAVTGGNTAIITVTLDRAGVANPILMVSPPTAIKGTERVTPADLPGDVVAFRVKTRPVETRRNLQVQALVGPGTRRATLVVVPEDYHPPKTFKSLGDVPTRKRLESLPPPNQVKTVPMRKEIPGLNFKSADSSARPTKHALIIAMENGGIVQNLKSLLGETNIDPKPRIWVAECGNFVFSLRVKEDLPAMLNRMEESLHRNQSCLNPAEWKFRNLPLDSYVDLMSDWILEEIPKAVAQAKNTSNRYDEAVVLEDESFTADRVITEIRRLARDHVLDIHFLAHGYTNRIAGFGNAWLMESTFFGPLGESRAQGGAPIYIRSVYQMNCRGGTLRDKWRTLGVETVNGTPGDVNNYMPQQYLGFLNRWLDGGTFEQATQSGFEEARIYSEAITALVGGPAVVARSQLIASGKPGIRVTSP